MINPPVYPRKSKGDIGTDIFPIFIVKILPQGVISVNFHEFFIANLENYQKKSKLISMIYLTTQLQQQQAQQTQLRLGVLRW